MTPEPKQELLRHIPSITELLKSQAANDWLKEHPASLVTECLRRAVAGLRQQIQEGIDSGPSTPAEEVFDRLTAKYQSMIDVES